jgi:hypothetical protein
MGIYMNFRHLSCFIPLVSTVVLSAHAMELPPEDNFDFLRTHHPVRTETKQLVDAVDESTILSPGAKRALFKELEVDLKIRAYFLRDISLSSLKTIDPETRKIAADTQKFKDFVEQNAEVRGAIQIVQELKINEQLATPSEKLYDKRKASKHLTTREDIVLVARKLADIALRAPTKQTVVLLGRTPGLVKVALEEFLTKYPHYKDKLEVVHVYFSGHPDALTLRNSEKEANMDQIAARETVTPESLNIYLDYLESLNLHIAKSIKIVDMMESGGGLNGFLRVYHKLCQRKSQQPAELELMVLTNEPTLSENKHEAWDYKDGVVAFKNLPKFNIKPYRIKATPLFIGRATLTILDRPEYQSVLYCGKSMHAFRWTKEYISSFQQLTPLQQECDTFLRVNFQKLIEWHEGLIQKDAQSQKESSLGSG